MMKPSPAAQPDSARVDTGGEGAIVYTSNEEGNWDIYRLDLSEPRPRRLTSRFQEEESAVASPDGERLAFVSRRDGDYEIYIMRIDGTQPQRLTFSRGIDEDPHWFPDGSRILFESSREGNWDIFMMNADGTDQINFTRTPFDEADPVLSPDGSRILLKSYREGIWQLAVMDLSDRSLTVIAPSDYVEGANDDPSWSPDGKRFVFVSTREGNSEIYAADLSESPVPRSVSLSNGVRAHGRPALRNLTQNTARDDSPVWSPEGSWIALVSDRDGHRKIYLMNPDGTDQHPLSPQPIVEGIPRWSSDGQWLAYMTDEDGERVVRLMSADGRRHRELARSKGDKRELEWISNRAEGAARKGEDKD